MTPYSKLRSEPRLPLSQVVPFEKPLTLYIEPTNACNLRCKCCPIGLDDYKQRAGGNRFMTKGDGELLRRNLEEIGGVKVIQWYLLGEPLANLNTPWFVKQFQGLAERQILTTNGTLLDERRSLQLIDAGLDYLRVSVYGATQESHAAETKSNIPLNRIVDNVRRFRELRDHRNARPYLYVKMLDRGEFENTEFKRLFYGVADEVEIEQRMNWNGSGSFGGSTAPESKQACPFPFYTLAIHADMKVSPCCVDWDRRVVIGDLQTQSLKEVWEGKKAHNLRMSHLLRRKHDGCKDCTYFKTNSPDDIDDLDPYRYAVIKDRYTGATT